VRKVDVSRLLYGFKYSGYEVRSFEITFGFKVQEAQGVFAVFKVFGKHFGCAYYIEKAEEHIGLDALFSIYVIAVGVLVPYQLNAIVAAQALYVALQRAGRYFKTMGMQAVFYFRESWETSCGHFLVNKVITACGGEGGHNCIFFQI